MVKKIFIKIFKRYKEKIFLYLFRKQVLIKTIKYGRLGNNIQQLLLLVAHYKVFGCNYFFEDEFINEYLFLIKFDYLPGFIEINNPSKSFISPRKIIKNNMYLFTRNYHRFFINSFLSDRIFRDSFLSKNRFLKMIPELVNAIKPAMVDLLKLSKSNEIIINQYNDICVLHLRGGDTIPPKNLNHISNPISYYFWLKKFYKEIIIIHEPSTLNPVIEEIHKIFDVKKTISSSLKDDFSLIANSKNVATSGVGTFAIAACLFNPILQNLFYSDAYLNEHLNPNFISSNVNKHCYELGRKFYTKWNSCSPRDRLKLVYKF